MERSPLHPHHQARLVNRGGVSSPSWERRGSSEGNRGAAPTTPGRSSKMRPGGRGDETVMLAAALIRLRSYSILFSWITPAVTAG
nr:unknown [Zea mays]